MTLGPSFVGTAKSGFYSIKSILQNRQKTLFWAYLCNLKITCRKIYPAIFAEFLFCTPQMLKNTWLNFQGGLTSGFQGGPLRRQDSPKRAEIGLISVRLMRFAHNR